MIKKLTQILIVFSIFYAIGYAQTSQEIYPTYFQYTSEELSKLSTLSSNLQISKDELIEWDQHVEKLLEKQPAKDANSSRIFAYLYTAQREVAFLSWNTHANFIGTLNPISAKVASLFFKEAAHPQFQSDDYSDYLAQIVLERIQTRLAKEEAQIKDYPIKEGSDFWRSKEGEKPFALNVGSWLPWLIQSNNQFRAPAPPDVNDSFWKQQCEFVHEAKQYLTEHKKEAILFWAGNKGPGSGDWGFILNQYLFKHSIPLAKILLVRSVFAQSFCDTLMAIFDSKYSYFVRRPAMMDPSIKEEIPCPNHPSYPSGHSTTAAMSATLLSYYFPSEKNHWLHLAAEAGYSRIWAGIHFPIDHYAGFEMGEKIGNYVTHLPQNQMK